MTIPVPPPTPVTPPAATPAVPSKLKAAAESFAVTFILTLAVALAIGAPGDLTEKGIVAAIAGALTAAVRALQAAGTLPSALLP